MTNETPTTARRVLAPEYGGPEVLRVVDEDVVQPGPGQVLIAVRAVGLNPADYKGFSGQRSSDPDALPIKPGYEVAGVVAALGADTELASGGGSGRRRGPGVPGLRRLRLRRHRAGEGRVRQAGRPRLPGRREPAARRVDGRRHAARRRCEGGGDDPRARRLRCGRRLRAAARPRSGHPRDRHGERAQLRHRPPVRRRARRIRRRAAGACDGRPPRTGSPPRSTASAPTRRSTSRSRSCRRSAS